MELLNDNNQVDSNRKGIVIIGGGVGGVLTALKFAEKGIYVTLIEKNDDILSGTSGMIPGRMGLGFHYKDLKTALHVLRATIKFAREYGDCFVGVKPSDENKDDQSDNTDYLKKGRYFVTKDSQLELDKVKELYKNIQQEYTDLVAEDKENRVFGDPKDFCHELSDEDMNDCIKKEYFNAGEVSAGFETNECILDMDKFKVKIKKQINEYKKNGMIKVKYNTEVSDIQYSPNGNSYILNDKKDKTFDFVINATWQNIERLNYTLGIDIQASRYSKRLKVLAEINLPESMKNTNSMFFCFGPHCMFTNLGNGRGRFTYAPVTNIEYEDFYGNMQSSWDTLTLPEKFQMLLDSKDKELNNELKQAHNKRLVEMVEGIISYIPAMKDVFKADDDTYIDFNDVDSIINAGNVNLSYGVVMSKGSVNINLADSDFHRRDYSGVESVQVGLINAASIKFTYCVDNAEKAYNLYQNQHKPIIDRFREGKVSELLENYLMDKNIHENDCVKKLLPYVMEEMKKRLNNYPTNDINSMLETLLQVEFVKTMKQQMIITLTNELLQSTSIKQLKEEIVELRRGMIVQVSEKVKKEHEKEGEEQKVNVGSGSARLFPHN